MPNSASCRDVPNRSCRDLVCGMNLEFVASMVRELGHTDLEARLDPAPDRCCVTLQKSENVAD